MHVTSYIAAHMIYQLMLCLLQTGLSLYVMKLLGVPFPARGFITPWMIVDIGITMLLISYASDMMSLFLSSISHTTTGAMTLMPFVLIFQLVFSGGIIPLPEWSKTLSNYTISNYGIKALTAQAGYNELPMVTAWKTLSGMRDTEVGGSVTVGELLDLLDSPAIQKQQDKEVLKSYTVGEVADILNDAESTLHLRDKEVITPFTLREFCNAIMQHSTFKQLREIELVPATEQDAAKTVGSVIQGLLADESLQQELDQEIGRTVTLGQVLDALHVSEIAKAASEETLNQPVTVGDITDFLKNNAAIQAQRDRTLTFKTTINDLFELFGEKKIETLVKTKTAKAAWNADYERSIENITDNWFMLSLFVIIFAILSIAVLEFIDKDKR